MSGAAMSFDPEVDCHGHTASDDIGDQVCAECGGDYHAEEGTIAGLSYADDPLTGGDLRFLCDSCARRLALGRTHCEECYRPVAECGALRDAACAGCGGAA